MTQIELEERLHKLEQEKVDLEKLNMRLKQARIALLHLWRNGSDHG